MPSLEIHHASFGGEHGRFEILDEEVVVGAAAECGVRLSADRDVVARHARILEHGAADYLIVAHDGDVEVNGAPTRSHVLVHGDWVRIGSAVLLFLEDGEPRPILPRAAREAIATHEAPAAEGATSADDAIGEPAPPAEPPAAAESAPPAGGLSIAPIRAVPVTRQQRAGVAGGRADESASGRAMRTASSRASARTPGGMPKWMFGSLALLLAVAAIFVTVRVLEANSGRTPGDLLNLAEAQLARGEIAMARSYVEQAAAAENLDPASRRRLEEIRATIDGLVTRKADQPALQQAGVGYRGLQRFHDRYLAGKPPRREAAREFVQMADDWLAAHREVCSRYPDEKLLVETIESLVGAQRPVAEMSTPDRVEDVLFRAGRRTRFKPDRNYREALAICDAWLRTRGEDPRAEEVRTQRAAWVADARDWTVSALRQIRKRAEDGASDVALERLRYLLDEAALPEFRADVEALLAEVRSMPQSGG